MKLVNNCCSATFDPAGTIVDYIAVPNNLDVINTSVLPFCSSSHNMVLSTIMIECKTTQSSPVSYTFSDDPLSIVTYQSCLSYAWTHLWSPLVLISRDVNLLNDVHRVIVHWASCRAFKSVGRRGRCCQWWTSTLSSLYNSLKLAYSDLILVKSQGLVPTFSAHVYSSAKRAYKAGIRKAKFDASRESFIRTEALRSKNPKEFWKVIRRSRRSAFGVPTTVLSDGVLVSGSEALNVWADAWETIGTHDFFDKSFDSQRALVYALTLPESLFAEPSDSFYLNDPVSFDEVDSIVSRMKLKAGGLDHLFSEQFKYGGSAMSRMLFDIVDQVWRTCDTPTIWRFNLIFPLFKKGDPLDVDNYRGITLQSLSCKVVDALITSRLKRWLKENKFVHRNQAGYQSGMMSVDWIFVVREMIFFHQKKKIPLFICFFDIRKAFDRVWVDGLFHILSALGIRGNFLRLLWTLYRLHLLF